MPAKRPEPLPLETQMSLSMHLLELYGAPADKDLWHRIDHVVTQKNRQICKLESQIEGLRKRT